jgi:SH3-like domain-containing protein
VNLETQSMLEGEKAFTLPLPLRLLEDVDVRQTPAEDSGIAFSLPAEMGLIGHSYKGQWVRVKTDEGISGWVYYKYLGNAD